MDREKEVVISLEAERFLQEQFPVGSEWHVPGLDICVKILRHERRERTPSWFSEAAFVCRYPVAVAQNTATILYSSDGQMKQEEEDYDLGVLSRCIPREKAAKLIAANPVVEKGEKANAL
jgi:hypothetical protein